MKLLKKISLVLAILIAVLTFNLGSVSAATNSEPDLSYTVVKDSVKTIKKTPYHSKDNKGNIYKGEFMADAPTVNLTKKDNLFNHRTTWNVTKKITVQVNKNKTRTYYFVTSQNKKVSGWTWKGYLYKGAFQSAD